MEKVSRKLALLAAGAVLLAVLPASPQAPPTSDADRTLQLLDRASVLYRRSALGFDCKEDIRIQDGGKTRMYRYDYIFAVDEKGRFQDARTRWRNRKESGEVRPSDLVNLDDLGVPVLRNAFLWALIFRSERRENHHFEVLGTETVLDRRAVHVRFEPVLPIIKDVNEWYGDAWADAETGQLLRVVAMHVEQYRIKAKAEKARNEGRGGGLHEYQVVSTEFGVLRAGMRFPSRAGIEGHWIAASEGAYAPDSPSFQVTQTYSEYEFFRVESAATIDGTGDTAPHD